MEIAENNKLISKYIIMGETQNKFMQKMIDNYSQWKSEFKEACHLIDNILGFKDKEKSLQDQLTQDLKKKTKQEIILMNEEDLLKPIEWSPEEILNPVELAQQAREKGLH